MSDSMSRSERLEELSQSGLVRKWEEGDSKDGLLVLEGKIAPSSSKGWTIPFPEGLLEDKDQDLAKEVMFSKNRILLDGSMERSYSFLQGQGDAVKHIKTLDILFDAYMISEWEDNKNHWKHLANFIANHLIVQDLDLSLDTGPCYETYQEWDSSEASLGEVKPVYQDIISILKTALAGKKPKSFSVYWIVFSNTEAQAEKQIMGEDYDLEHLGKIPSNRRSPHFPHGAPKKEFEFLNGVRF